MDHGLLNVPLAKRGDINRQLDTYKAQQASAAKQKAREAAQRTAAMRIEAKAVLAAMPADQLARIAQKAGLTVKQATKQLQGLAYFEPARVVALKG